MIAVSDKIINHRHGSFYLCWTAASRDSVYMDTYIWWHINKENKKILISCHENKWNGVEVGRDWDDFWEWVSSAHFWDIHLRDFLIWYLMYTVESAIFKRQGTKMVPPGYQHVFARLRCAGRILSRWAHVPGQDPSWLCVWYSPTGLISKISISAVT